MKQAIFQVIVTVDDNVDTKDLCKRMQNYLEFGADEAEWIEGAIKHSIVSVEEVLTHI